MAERIDARGLGDAGEFIELDELPIAAPAPHIRAVRVSIRRAVRRALEERRGAPVYVNGETNRITNTNTDPAAPGLVGGSTLSGDNLVEIDAAALAAENEGIEIPQQAGAPPEGAPPAPGASSAATGAPELTLEQLQAHVPAWKGGTDLIVNTLADVVAPNWRATRDEREQVSGAFALALAAWFPDDAIPIKYLVLMNAGAAIWNLAASRRDPNTGKFIPLRIAPAADAAKTGGEAPAPASSGPATTSTASGVTTSA